MSYAAIQIEVVPDEQVEKHGTSCIGCPIRQHSVCAALSDEELPQLQKIRRRRRVDSEEQLAWEGDDHALLATVREGVVAMTASTIDGQDQIVGLAFAGDFVGRPFGGTTAFGIVPIGNVELCVFPRDAFDKLAREHRNMEHQLLLRTLEELDKTRGWLRLLGKTTARQKLAAFLIDLSRRSSVATERLEGPHLRLPFNRRQIADILGLTIETVSRQFTMLREAGIVSLPNRRDVLITNLADLQRDAGNTK
jgi:CRP/FNR family transcriptional regulator